MGYFGWKPYVSVAERRRKAEKAAARQSKGGASLSPVAPYSGAIAKSVWGKAWCDNLERYSDYANRLPRGRTYVRNGSVIDLRVAAGEVRAQVMGSSLYQVSVSVASVPEKQWQAIGADCAGSIDSMVELLQGKLSKAVMERICAPGTGLFPAPKEIKCSCSCPDWAATCKHVAAVLYGIGARLDNQPELLFTLRRVDAKDLVAKAVTGVPITKKGPRAGKLLDASALAGVFDLEMAEEATPAKAATPRKKPAAAKTGKAPVKPVTAAQARRTAASKPKTPRKVAAVKPVKAELPKTTTKAKVKIKAVSQPKAMPKTNAAAKSAR